MRFAIKSTVLSLLLTHLSSLEVALASQSAPKFGSYPGVLIAQAQTEKDVAGAEPKDQEQGVAQASAPSTSAPKKAPENAFVNQERSQKFLESLGSTSRDTGLSKKKAHDGIRLVLDIRLPMIFQHCDVSVSHEILLYAYAYVTQMPGAETQLRMAADSLAKKSPTGFRGIKPECQVALKGFGVAILRVYLGSEWNTDDEKRLEKAVTEGQSRVGNPDEGAKSKVNMWDDTK